jgi:hypothetical protein
MPIMGEVLTAATIDDNFRPFPRKRESNELHEIPGQARNDNDE